MVQNAIGTIVGSDLSKMGGVLFGRIVIETQDGTRLNLQITKETIGSVPSIGSTISVDYAGDEINRAEKIEIIHPSRKSSVFTASSSKDSLGETALERGLYDMVVIVILQSLIALECVYIGSQTIIIGTEAWLTYLYVAIGIFHLIIAAGLFLMQSWSYAASLTVTVITTVFLIVYVVFLIPASLVIIYLFQERVRNYYE